jgi:hypothetical protein
VCTNKLKGHAVIDSLFTLCNSLTLRTRAQSISTHSSQVHTPRSASSSSDNSILLHSPTHTSPRCPPTSPSMRWASTGLLTAASRLNTPVDQVTQTALRGRQLTRPAHLQARAAQVHHLQTHPHTGVAGATLPPTESPRRPSGACISAGQRE